VGKLITDLSSVTTVVRFAIAALPFFARASSERTTVARSRLPAGSSSCLPKAWRSALGAPNHRRSDLAMRHPPVDDSKHSVEGRQDFEGGGPSSREGTPAAEWHKGSCIPGVQVLFGRKFKGLVETAPIYNLLSQRYRNIRTEAGAITSLVDRRDISFILPGSIPPIGHARRPRVRRP